MANYNQMNYRRTSNTCTSTPTTAANCYPAKPICETAVPVPLPSFPDCECMEQSSIASSKTPCSGQKDQLQGLALAIAYVPWQHYQNLYDPCMAFKRGTIFQELDLEFCGRRCN